MINLVLGVLGGCAAVLVAMANQWHIGPVYTVGNSLLGGLVGLWVSKTIAEPIIKKRVTAALEKAFDKFGAGGGGYKMPEEYKLIINVPPREPKTQPLLSPETPAQ
jgi:hypothetical protein